MNFIEFYDLDITLEFKYYRGKENMFSFEKCLEVAENIWVIKLGQVKLKASS